MGNFRFASATIHRYLKEIEEEEGGKIGAKVAVSEALQDLAERLYAEYDARIAEISAWYVAERVTARTEQDELQAKFEILQQSLAQAHTSLTEEQAAHRQTNERLRGKGADTPGQVDVKGPSKRWNSKTSDWRPNKLSGYMTKYLAKTFEQTDG